MYFLAKVTTTTTAVTARPNSNCICVPQGTCLSPSATTAVPSIDIRIVNQVFTITEKRILTNVD